MTKNMKKIGLFISIVFSSLLANAQTGTGDDFDRAGTGTTGMDAGAAWVQTGTADEQYKLYLYGNELVVQCKDGGLNYIGFGYQFSPIDIMDAPLVSVKIKSSYGYVMRVDLIDANGRRTNQIDTKQTIKSDGKYNDYLFDFTGRFYQQYGTNNGPVDATQIVRMEFITDPKGNLGVGQGFNKNFTMDSVMIGTRAKSTIVTGARGIKLNQIGFFKEGQKKAVINGASAATFTIVNEANTVVYSGNLSATATWTYSGESVRIADFSNFKTPGKYRLMAPGIPNASYPFVISNTPLSAISKASVKGFYYQRASTALPATYAGIWSRAAGHPDNQVEIHNSAVSPGRAAGSKISSPRGWYDAGDYNKYIVNSGISTYTLLAAYEHFSTYYDTLNLNIPESANSVPDVLDEALYNIRWMLTMQDPYDGGVYHKLTNANFDGDIMPSAATQKRYVVQKSTGATLDFAAVMAQSARIYSKFPTQLPGLADSCIKAAKKAYDWAILNPNIFYVQENLTSPAITTGTYDDWSFADEQSWAAAELFTTTLSSEYYNDINLSSGASIPGWQNVYTLGLISMAHNRVVLGDNSDSTFIKNKIVTLANVYRDHFATGSAYGIAMGANGGFGWGSNSQAANQSMILIQAFNYTKDSSYLKAAVSNVDYILGRNGVNYCFVTGSGSLGANRPHHRVSQADGIAPAVPGLLVGGPNSGQQDNCPGYPSSQPALSYVDSECSYSTNEIAINWNAPLAYITGAIQSIYAGIEPSKRDYTVDTPTSTRDAILKNTFINIYPNPAASSITVVKPFEITAKPIILDLNGREYPVTGDWSTTDIQLNLSDLKAGMYLIRLQGENGAAVQKFTVIK
ncbi:non-processive endocellulase [Cytophaga hutchinsonii ATCC 33406]|uniref:Endoglucanase n=2 Tax=Cytophaga hutchinsonii TaxID=985 RepID=A0A6N4SRJ0_CYTH3|nr:non-processive endocellulase [Cytophaga hutchinsonii ATCC 33406]